MLVLGDAHRPGANNPIGTLINCRRFADLCLCQAGLRHNLHPVGVINRIKIGLNAMGFGIQESLVEQAAFARRKACTMRFQQGFHHAANGSHITAQMRLVIGRADGARFRRDNFQRLLRIGKTFQTALA